EQLEPLGGNGEIHGAVSCHLGNLQRRTLMHMQRNVGVLVDEPADNLRQGVTRLGVSSGDAQRALFLVGELLGNLLDAFAFSKDYTCDGDDPLTGRRHTRQMLATAGKNLYPQLIFEQPDLLADTGL